MKKILIVTVGITILGAARGDRRGTSEGNETPANVPAKLSKADISGQRYSSGRIRSRQNTKTATSRWMSHRY